MESLILYYQIWGVIILGVCFLILSSAWVGTHYCDLDNADRVVLLCIISLMLLTPAYFGLDFLLRAEFCPQFLPGVAQ
jgi:hypothetical protein